MAALITVPATPVGYGGVSPDSNPFPPPGSRFGPYFYGTARYCIGAQEDYGMVFKSADGGATWIEQDGANRPHFNETENYLCPYYKSPTDGLGFIHLYIPTAAGFRVKTFDCATDSYATQTNADAVADVEFRSVQLLRSSNGDFLAFYVDGTTGTVNLKRYTGGAWNPPAVMYTSASAASPSLNGASIDSANTVHLFIGDKGDLSAVTVMYLQVSSADAPGVAVQLQASGGSLTAQGGTPALEADAISFAYSFSGERQVYASRGTPLTAPAWTTTLIDTAPAGATAEWPTGAINGNGLPVILYNLLNFTSPFGPLSLSQMWRVTGSASGGWFTPRLIYDGIINPPTYEATDFARVRRGSFGYSVSGAAGYIQEFISDANFNTLFSMNSTDATAAATPPSPSGRKPVPLVPNQFDFCLHREFRAFQQIDYELLGCGRLPSCFKVDEREWGGWE